MPEGFNNCVSNDGRVRTVTAGTPAGKKLGLKENQYCHVCVDKQGNFHKGEVRTKKKTIDQK